MIAINRILEYQAEVCDVLRDENDKKLFNYFDMIIDDSELSKVLKERVPDDNTFLISVMPDFYLKGQEDESKFENVLQFFILDKTDYSEHDRDEFRSIFVQTQQKTLAFIKKLLADKTNSSSSFCGFLNNLREDSILVSPVWKKESCNGWTFTINFDTNI